MPGDITQNRKFVYFTFVAVYDLSYIKWPNFHDRVKSECAYYSVWLVRFLSEISFLALHWWVNPSPAGLVHPRLAQCEASGCLQSPVDRTGLSAPACSAQS